MAWQRKDGYYYHSVRDGKKVRSIYMGPACIIEPILQIAAESQGKEDPQSKARAELDGEDAEMATFEKVTTMLARATLYASGGYRHHKGEWRKRREER